MAGGRESGRRERRASSRPPPPTSRPAQGEAGTPSNAHGPTARVFLRAPHPAAWEPEKEPDAPRPGRQRGRQLRAGGPPPGRATQAAPAAARKRRRRRRVCALASPVGSLRPAHPGMDRQPLSTPGDTDTEARCPTTTTLPLKKHKKLPPRTLHSPARRQAQRRHGRPRDRRPRGRDQVGQGDPQGGHGEGHDGWVGWEGVCWGDAGKEKVSSSERFSSHLFSFARPNKAPRPFKNAPATQPRAQLPHTTQPPPMIRTLGGAPPCPGARAPPGLPRPHTATQSRARIPAAAPDHQNTPAGPDPLTSPGGPVPGFDAPGSPFRLAILGDLHLDEPTRPAFDEAAAQLRALLLGGVPGEIGRAHD